MTTPLLQSSGDMIADRRFVLAEALSDRGDLAAAADVLTQAIERAPRFVSAWHALGEVRELLGDRDGAVAAFQQACALDPEDRHGAGLHLVRLGALPPGDMPAAYVRTLFDQYAPSFRTTLTQRLGYRGPQILHQAIAAACKAEGRPMDFTDMLDLGCGTGLVGEVFFGCTRRIVGVDLSERMVAELRKGPEVFRLYDRVENGDLLQFLHAEACDDRRYDLIVAADVFPYLAWLPPVIAAAAGVLVPGGLLTFTVETHAGDDVVLGAKLRYQHGAAHVREAIAGAGLTPVSIDERSARNERGSPSPGLVVVAQS